MLSEYDIENAENIIAGDGSWFTAVLMRFFYSLPDEDKECFRNSAFSDVLSVVDAVKDKNPNLLWDGYIPDYEYVFAKADSTNRLHLMLSGNEVFRVLYTKYVVAPMVEQTADVQPVDPKLKEIVRKGFIAEVQEDSNTEKEK